MSRPSTSCEERSQERHEVVLSSRRLRGQPAHPETDRGGLRVVEGGRLLPQDPIQRKARNGEFAARLLIVRCMSVEHAPLLQNVVVRRVAGSRDRYEVIAGARRFDAARQKGWSHVEANIVDVPDRRPLRSHWRKTFAAARCRTKRPPSRDCSTSTIARARRRSVGTGGRRPLFQSGKVVRPELVVRADGEAAHAGRMQWPRQLVEGPITVAGAPAGDDSGDTARTAKKTGGQGFS